MNVTRLKLGLLSIKDTTRKMKMEAKEWKMVFVIHMTDKELSQICKSRLDTAEFFLKIVNRRNYLEHHLKRQRCKIENRK